MEWAETIAITVDTLMHKVPSDTSRSLTDVFKTYITDELQPAQTA